MILDIRFCIFLKIQIIMILPIYTYGSPVLREQAKEVDIKMEGLNQLLTDMYETMKHAEGVGIAAPQVGKSLRILIVDGSDLSEDFPELKSFIRYMINPVVLQESAETADYSEGCLSVPDVRADVTRPAKIKVRYVNEKLQEVEEEFDGFACRMVQHEIDHLNGKMFVDRVSPLRKKLMGGKLRRIEKGEVRTRYRTEK